MKLLSFKKWILCLAIGSALNALCSDGMAVALRYRTIYGRAYDHPSYNNLPTAFSQGGRLFASTASMHEDEPPLRIWDSDAGKLLDSFDIPNTQFVRFSPDSRWLALIVGQRGRYGVDEGFSIQLRDRKTGKLLRTFVKAGSVNAAFYALAFSPDGNLLAAGSGDGLIRVWNTGNGKRLATLRHGGFVDALAFSPVPSSPASVTLASVDHADSGDDAKVKLWNISSKKLLASTSAGTTEATFAFCPDGKQLIVNSLERRVRFHRVPDLKVLRELPPVNEVDGGGDTTQVAVSADGYRIAFVRGQNVTVRDASAPKRIIARFAIPSEEYTTDAVADLHISANGREVRWAAYNFHEDGIYRMRMWRARRFG